MESFEAGTLAGAGSFHCESCGFAVALREGDEIPPCPSCGSSTFERSRMFGGALAPALPGTHEEAPGWLAEARDALLADGDYLAFESDGTVRVVPLQEGWTRIGRSLSAHVRIEDTTVSRRHALVYRDGEGATVLDDRSLNGVFRNGERIDLAELRDGDTIAVGRFALHFITLTGGEAGGGGSPAREPRREPAPA